MLVTCYSDIFQSLEDGRERLEVRNSENNEALERIFSLRPTSDCAVGRVKPGGDDRQTMGGVGGNVLPGYLFYP